MIPPVAPSLRRVLAVAWLTVAWLAFTNHCALLLLQADAPAAEAAIAKCCGVAAGDEAGQEPAPAGHAIVCCKALKAALAEKLDLPIAALVALPDPALSAAPLPLAPLQLAADSTGARAPPRALTFAELVLQGCLRSHAPPLAA